MTYEEAKKLYGDACHIKVYGSMNSKEAFEMLLKSAEGGYEDAFVAVGMAYRDGSGTEKNASEALKWFTLAADRGDTSGIACLDDVYQDLYGDDWEDYYVPAMERYASMGYQEAAERLAFKRQHGLIGKKRTQGDINTMKLPSGTGRTEYNRIKLFILVISIISCIFLLAHC